MSMTVEMILKLVDQLTGPMRKAQDELKNLQRASQDTKPGSTNTAAWDAQAKAIHRATAEAERLKRATQAAKPAAITPYLEQARAIHKAAEEAERLERAAAKAANRWANLGGAMFAMQRMSQMGQTMARPFDQAIDSAAAFEDKVNDIATAAEQLDKQKEIGERVMRVAKAANLPWQDVAQGQRDILGLGGTEMLDKIGPIEERIGRLTYASRAEASDLYKVLNTYMGVVGMKPDQALRNLEINYKQGKEGAFELKDMARFMPSLGAAAKSYGLSGDQVGRDIPALLQLVRRVVGEPGEAATRIQHGFSKLADPMTAKKVKKELDVDIYDEAAQARKTGENPLFRVLGKIADKIESKGGQGELSKDGNAVIGGDPKKMGEIARDYYFRALLNAYTAMRGEIGKFQIDPEAAAKQADVDFEARKSTALAAKQRLETAKAEVKIAAGDTQLDHRKKMYGAGEKALEKVTSATKSNPGVASWLMLGGEVGGHAMDWAGKAGSAGVGLWGAWKGAQALGAKYPLLGSIGSNVWGVGKGLALSPFYAMQGFGQGVGGAWSEAMAARAAAAGASAATGATTTAGVAGAATASRLGMLARFGGVTSGLEAVLRAAYAAAGAPLHETPEHAAARRRLEAGHNAGGSSRAQDDALKARLEGMRQARAASEPQAVATMAGGGGPTVNTTQIDAATSRASEAGSQILTALNVTASPQVDSSQIDALIAKLTQAASLLAGLGAKAAAAARSIGASSAALHDGTETR
jgi:hypothetical protein